MIGKRFDRVNNNFHVLNQLANRHHNEYLAPFRNIEQRLAPVKGNPVAPQPLYPPPNLQQLTIQGTPMQPPLPPPPDIQQPAPPPPLST